jgi:hypothetical protein
VGGAPERLQAFRDKVANGFSEYIPASGVSISGISRPDISGAVGGADLRLTLRFTITEPTEESYPFTFTLNIPGGEPIPVNASLALKLPVVNPASITVTQGSGGSSVVTFTNALTLQVMTQPLHGSVSLANDGSYTYRPNGDYFGTDSFTYRGTNLDGNSLPATVSISVVRDFAGTWTITVIDTPNETDPAKPCFERGKSGTFTSGISKASDTLYLANYNGNNIELRMASVDDPSGLSYSGVLTYPEDNGTTEQSLSISVPDSNSLSGGGNWVWNRPPSETSEGLTCTGRTQISGTK